MSAVATTEREFADLIEPHRRELHAHCYRMLGSVQDAEDALQDALLRAWRALDRFEGRSSVRSWLYRIATNTCLDVANKRPKRVLPLDASGPAGPDEVPGRPLVESVWIEPYPDQPMGLPDGAIGPDSRYEQREAVELAFVAAVQHLPATQRAVLLMREVLGFSAREVAEALDTTVASVNSALQRARAAVEERVPAEAQQATLRALGDAEQRKLVGDYMAAMAAGDVPKVVSLLAEEATWSMPPLATWWSGREAIRGWLARHPLNGSWEWRHVPTRASGQLAVGTYTWHADASAFLPFSIDVLDLTGGPGQARIVAVTSFIGRSPDETAEAIVDYPDTPPHGTLTRRFGLPPKLDR